MIIPEGYGLVNILFLSVATPTGAAVTFGVQNASDFTAAVAGEKVVDAWQTSDIMGPLSSSCATSALRIKLGPTEDGPSYERAMSIGGLESSAAVPPNTSALVRKFTARGGRKGRGRFFLPGLPEGNVTSGGIIDSGIVTALNDACATLLTELANNDVPMALLHDGPETPNLVSGLTVSDQAATQRRRLRR
jgi:hypothetical protein